MVARRHDVFNKESRSTNVKRNMLVGGLSVAIPTLLVFISRKVFLDTLNLQYLGLSETFTSILGSLALTEMGFQAAILYNLYKPIQDNDIDKVNRLINILRIIFNYIGLIFIVVPILLLPFIGYLLKGVDVSNSVRIYFILIALSSAITYFLSYPRCLLQADQKEYIIKSTDLVIQIVFVGLQIVVLLVWKSFVLYLTLNIFRNVCSNLLIHLYCKEKYTFLHKVPFDKLLFKNIWSNTKNIFVGRMAGVVYSSIDNILISTFISTVAVGSFANYSTVSTMIKAACYRLFPIGSIIGNMLADESQDVKHSELIFRVYTVAKSITANIILIPLLLLFNPFISIWLGKEYLFSEHVVFLVIFDMYAFFLTNPVGDFIFARGLFKQDKKITLIGLVVNAFFSLILIHFFGIIGVLLGTAISQIVIWVGRCRILYRYIFVEKEMLRRYILTQLFYMMVFVVSYILTEYFIEFLGITYTNYLLLFSVGSCVVVFVMLLTALSYHRIEEYRYLMAKIMKRKQ